MDSAPGMCPAAYSSAGRTSMTVAVPALTRSSSCSRVRWSVSSGPEVGGAGLVGGGPVGAGDLLQQRVQGGDVVADETVVDAHAVAAGGDESGLPEGLQVGGGGGQAESGGLGEGVDAALALGEQVEQFQAFAVGQPMRSGRWAWRISCSSSRVRSMWPSVSASMTTTSAIDSRQGSSLEWCSYGPTKTTGLPRALDSVRAGETPMPGGGGVVAGRRSSRKATS